MRTNLDAADIKAREAVGGTMESLGLTPNAYITVLQHVLDDVINPRDSARGIIFAVQRRIKIAEEL